jgi:large subunit ribosomal protein L17
VKKVKLGRDAAHRRAMLKNMATSILKQGVADDQSDRYVKTTVAKAKAVRGLVDRLITYAKKGDLSARRQAAKFVQEPKVLQDLFDLLGPRYADRNGGYTRILKISDNRHGDNAEMALVGLVEDTFKAKPAKKSSEAPKAADKVDMTESASEDAKEA